MQSVLEAAWCLVLLTWLVYGDNEVLLHELRISSQWMVKGLCWTIVRRHPSSG